MTSRSTPVSPQHESARRWAAAGFAVFPCLRNQKVPAVETGYKAATTDLGQIDAWWQANPNYNPACAPEASGFCVLDVDDKPGKDGSISLLELELQHGSMPPTLVTWTASGGRHIWFKGSLPSTVGRLGPGLDTRGVGGYVLLPGSVIDGKSYKGNPGTAATVPAWLVTAVGATKDKILTPAVTTMDLDVNVQRAKDWLIHLARKGDVAIEGEGGNDRTYRLFAALKDLGISEAHAIQLVAAHWNPKCQPPWDDSDLERLANNAYHYGQNAPGAKGEAPDSAVFSEVRVPEKAPGRPRFYPMDESEQDNLPEPQFLIGKRWPKHSTIMYYGPKASYKSFVVLNECLALAAGKAGFDGYNIPPVPVLYAAGEGARGIARLRRPAWRQKHGITGPIPFYVTDSVPLLGDRNQISEFFAAVDARAIKPGVVVFDTLSRVLAGMNENDAQDASRAVEFLDAVKRHWDCIVVAIHHTGKDRQRGERGSSVLSAGMDAVYMVEAHSDTRCVRVTCDKMKDADLPEAVYLKGESISDSLVFGPIPAQEYRNLTATGERVNKKRIGEALKALNAFGFERAVTSKVLAAEIARLHPLPDTESAAAQAQYVETMRHWLQRNAEQFEAYLANPLDTKAGWCLPA